MTAGNSLECRYLGDFNKFRQMPLGTMKLIYTTSGDALGTRFHGLHLFGRTEREIA